MRGYQCLKSIFLTIHHPELEAPTTPDKQAIFDQGSEVGELARNEFPGGVLVDNAPWDFFGSLKKTRELISSGVEIIYEAAFEHRGCYARADIIRFSKDTKKWTVFEVKSSTKLKDEHVDDIGLQAWIMAGSGLPLEKINLVHLNADCRFPDLDNLFTIENITERLRGTYPGILPKVSEIFATIQKNSVPPIDIGPHCTSPYECGFMDSCWKEKKVPEISVLTLPQNRAKKWELYKQGVIALDDPRLTDLSPIQERAVNAFKTGERLIDKAGIKAGLAGWKFPLVFLDFETTAPAIPRYEGCGPYSQTPFQYSVHIWNTPDAELVHKEFLHIERTDPRPALIPSLLEDCGTVGSIVAYYGRFESDRISELAGFSPRDKAALEALMARIVDPLPIFRDHVYDNKFNGSFSLKVVAPAILGEVQSYEGMLVADGSAAQRAFEYLISEGSRPDAEEVKAALLEYCKKDTLVMVELVRWLYEQAEDELGVGSK